MIYQLAGAAGVDPGPFTLRELLAMSEGADRARWVHTSALLALIYNVNRDPKKTSAKRPRHFNPWERGKAKKVSVRELKELMTRGRTNWRKERINKPSKGD